MLDDIKKSINDILFERISSPLFGTFFFAWAVWNWKIIYLTIFVSQDKLKETKLDYILGHFFDGRYVFWYPILSTVVLLTIMPFITNGAFWLSLKFQKWRLDQKKKIELKQLLTLEQSIELRELLSVQSTKFDELLKERNDKFKQKDFEIEILQKQLSSITMELEKERNSFLEYRNSEDAERQLRYSIEVFFDEKDNIASFFSFISRIQNSTPVLTGSNGIDSHALAQLESLDAVTPKGDGVYTWGLTGKKFVKYFTENKKELMERLNKPQ